MPLQAASRSSREAAAQGAAVWAAVGAAVWAAVRAAVGAAVWAAVRAAVGAMVCSTERGEGWGANGRPGAEKPGACRTTAALFRFPQLLKKPHDYFLKPDSCFLNTWDHQCQGANVMGKALIPQ